MIYLDKINKKQLQQIEEQKTILQNIINAGKNISFVTDFNHISFANSAFLNFFNIKSIEEFRTRFEKIEEMFVDHHDYIHKGLIENNDNRDYQMFAKAFYSKINEIDDTKRVVLMLDKTLEPKSFYLSISIIEEEKQLFLINLTDITKMTIQRVKTEHKAYYDGLTQVYNRNKFDEVFGQELLRVQRYHHPLSIAILDIDHFKNFNDTFGHLIGDEVLIMLAENLDDKVRNTDTFARWGGEEFVILFVETQLKDAIVTANILREHIEKIEHKTAGKITASFGVTQYQEGDTLDSLFKRCDEALYMAKENGRNRVEFK